MRNRTGETADAPRYPLASVDNVLRLLLLLQHGRPVRVSEAAAELGVARSTAHRLLTTLEHRGFVRQDAVTRTYLVGDALVGLGRSVIRDAELEAVALPELQALVARVRETAHVSVLRGNTQCFIACVESPETLRTGAHVGMSFPAHATAGGKALLAELPERALRELFAGEHFTPLSRTTVRTWSALRSALDDVRRRGYGTNFEESERGVNAIGVAIKDGAGRVHGAITVTGPSSRFGRQRVTQAARELTRSAERIATLLGSRIV